MKGANKWRRSHNFCNRGKKAGFYFTKFNLREENSEADASGVINYGKVGCYAICIP